MTPVPAQNCGNCRHYLQHYDKRDYLGFRKIHCGHCTKSVRKKIKPNFVCDDWEAAENKEQEQKTALKQSLEVMAKRIEQIAGILTHEE